MLSTSSVVVSHDQILVTGDIDGPTSSSSSLIRVGRVCQKANICLPILVRSARPLQFKRLKMPCFANEGRKIKRSRGPILRALSIYHTLHLQHSTQYCMHEVIEKLFVIHQVAWLSVVSFVGAILHLLYIWALLVFLGLWY